MTSILDKVSRLFSPSPKPNPCAPTLPTIEQLQYAQQAVQLSTQIMERALERNKDANNILIKLVERSAA